MDESEIKKRKKRFFTASIITFLLAVVCLVCIVCTWYASQDVAVAFLVSHIFLVAAGVITLSLGFAEGTPDEKRKYRRMTAAEKADMEEFEEICMYDLLDDD